MFFKFCVFSVEATSTQVTRGCKAQSDLTGAFEALVEAEKEGVPVLEKNGKPSLTEEVCEDVNTRGLSGSKCTTKLRKIIFLLKTC